MHRLTAYIQLAASADLDRELQDLKREEVKLQRDIKAELKKGNQSAARQLARSLLRVRTQQARLQANKGQISGVSSQIRVCIRRHYSLQYPFRSLHKSKIQVLQRFEQLVSLIFDS